MGLLEGKLRNAANNGELKKVEASLEAGAVIDAVNKHGSTALHLAVQQGHLLVVGCLLGRGASTSIKDSRRQTALQIATAMEHIRIVEMLLLKCTEPMQTDLDLSFRLAIAYANPELVELLIKYGADINRRDEKGYTALDEAKRPLAEIRVILPTSA